MGEYDCTPAAMEMAGVELLARGAALKPGMAGAYGIYHATTDPTRAGDGCSGHTSAGPAGDRDAGSSRGIPVMALSGNPAACMTAFYAIAQPVLKKRMGLADPLPQTVQVSLEKAYSRKNQSDRLLRGKIDLSASVQKMTIFEKQGNQQLSSLAGADALALIPAGSCILPGEPVEALLLE